MDDAPNPLLPASYDIVWMAMTAVVIAVTLVALISLARSVARLSPAQGLLWCALVLVVPLLGPTAWFAIGRRTAQDPRGVGLE